MNQKVILVNQNNQPIGAEKKLKAHQDGKLHRAFSVFVFNHNKELLLQKRAKTKYHCAGLWSNTCCSHPRFDELTERAAGRRLKEDWIVLGVSGLLLVFYELTRYYGMQIVEKQKKIAMAKIEN